MMFWAYLKYEFLMLTRRKSYTVLSIGLPMIFYILFTSMIKLPPADQEIFNKEYMFSMATYSLISFCILTFPLELISDKQHGWVKNLVKTPLSLFHYYMCKTLKIMFLFCLAIVLLYLTGAIYKGVSMSIDEWLLSGVFLWLGASSLLSLGILLSQMNDLQNTSAIANILYLGLAMLGGLWFPVSTFPSWLKQIAYVTPTYHIKELAFSYTTSDGIHISSCYVLVAYAILFLTITYVIRKKTEVI
ncbi:ABC transporter permease [Staphylococcus americanisciuri]|uniref:ABC transporter permease n=1 Tax=Staphylococcus americanisciuri TaxID=2973940 RepID=A0ABT2F160_9STAP|nr:ABC transporter permease [Staphylococcus americanisciuri]MCS4486172.1 ABC transporter permease [Staphylococcus americanisciuri]